MRPEGVSVAIVLGARESRVHGEGPQLERWVRSNPAECEGLGILADASRALRTGNPLRRSPCAVKVARTVTTGGMGKHSLCAMKCSDRMDGKSLWLYQEASEPLGLSVVGRSAA